MSKSLRLSEKWFRRGLWLVALVFAGFLIGLGGTVVDDLPRVEAPLQLDDYLDRQAAEALRAQVRTAERAQAAARSALEQARLQQDKAASETAAEREGFDNWLATRSATQQSEYNPEVLRRTKALDALKAREQQARQAVQAQQQAALDASQAASAARQQLRDLEDGGYQRLNEATRKVELRVFLYRLALTLPLLAAAGWLFARKRKEHLLALRVGLHLLRAVRLLRRAGALPAQLRRLCALCGGHRGDGACGALAIAALNRYLERQRLAESLPDAQRREELSYDVALARLAKGVCPGCERSVDLKDPAIDFCPHCGIGLFDRCGSCTTRKNRFRPLSAMPVARAHQPGSLCGTTSLIDGDGDPAPLACRISHRDRPSGAHARSQGRPERLHPQAPISGQCVTICVDLYLFEINMSTAEPISQDLLAALARAVQHAQPCIELDARGQVVGVNAAFLQISQHPEGDVLGHHYRQCFPRPRNGWTAATPWAPSPSRF